GSAGPGAPAAAPPRCRPPPLRPPTRPSAGPGSGSADGRAGSVRVAPAIAPTWLAYPRLQGIDRGVRPRLRHTGTVTDNDDGASGPDSTAPPDQVGTGRIVLAATPIGQARDASPRL